MAPEAVEAIIVTVLYTPSPWLASMKELVEVPVRCVVSKAHGNAIIAAKRVDLATPQHQLPTSAVAGESRHHFRNALRTALEDHLGCKVTRIPYDRIDWGDGGA